MGVSLLLGVFGGFGFGVFFFFSTPEAALKIVSGP